MWLKKKGDTHTICAREYLHTQEGWSENNVAEILSAGLHSFLGQYAEENLLIDQF